MNEVITIPFANGLSIRVEPGFAHHLGLLMPHLTNISSDIRRFETSPLISEYLDTVLGRFLRESHLSGKSQKMLISRFEKLKRVLTSIDPDRRIAQLDETDLRNLKQRLPRELRKNQRSGSQGSNIETHYQLFNRIVDQAVEDKLLTQPLKITITRSKAPDPTRPFLDSDLQALLCSWPMGPYPAGFRGLVLEDAKPYRFWLMPLGLFTGARLNELCQLQASDIVQDSHSIHLISINDNQLLKSLKNEQSRREIPICSPLIEMGFLEFVEERRQADGATAQLFAELEYHPDHLYSRDPSRFFCGARTGAGFIGRYCPQAEMGGLNFKSFRRTFAQRLEQSAVPARTIALLLGHESEGLAVMEKHYLDKPPSQALLDDLERGLTYNVCLDGLHWNQFKNLMASQKLRQKRGRKKQAN